MRIGRREFFKRTAVTTAAAVVAPAVVTEAEAATEPKLTPVSGEHGEPIYHGVSIRRRLYKDVDGNYLWVRDLT